MESANAPLSPPLVRAANISSASLRAHIERELASAYRMRVYEHISNRAQRDISTTWRLRRAICASHSICPPDSICASHSICRGGPPAPLFAARKNPSRSLPSRSRSEHIERELASVYRMRVYEHISNRAQRDISTTWRLRRAICASHSICRGGPPAPLFAARKNPSRSLPSRSRSEHLAREFTSVYRARACERISSASLRAYIESSGARYIESSAARYACGARRRGTGSTKGNERENSSFFRSFYA